MQQPKTNIALVGFMGAGKSVVGGILSEKLHRPLVELDTVIEQKTGKSIAEIFRQEGEEAFRALEFAALREVAAGKNLVISCGGGIVLDKTNVALLKTSAIVVYLTASSPVISKRLSNSNGRPLIDSPDRLARIKDLTRARKPYYEEAADITVNTSRQTPEEVAEIIIKRLKKHESFGL
jgi:shikimate kinase